MLKKEYKALGLKEEASESQVKEAYNKKVQSILASKTKDSRMLKELKKIQSSYLKIINQQNDEVQNHPEEDLSLEGLKDTIKNSLNNLYISVPDIYKLLRILLITYIYRVLISKIQRKEMNLEMINNTGII